MDRNQMIKQLETIKSKLLLTISEYDYINLKEATALRIEYTKKIGQFECRQFELFLQFEELKRKIEMIQAALNKGAKPDITEINTEVANTLQEFYEKLSGMRKCVIEFISFESGVPTSGSDRSEIKHLYREITKVLHPDVADSEKFDSSLWQRAMDAYMRNDLEDLRVISDIVSESENSNYDDLSEDNLIEKIERLELAIKRYELLIEEIKTKFPFIEEEHLKNDAWVRAKQAELKNNISEYEKAVEMLVEILNEKIIEAEEE